MDALAGGASMRKKVTICECGLAKCYHEGSHDIATKPRNGQPAICTGYRPRAENYWKQSAARRIGLQPDSVDAHENEGRN